MDALRIPIRRDTVSKESFYVVLVLRRDLKREVLGIYHLPEECLEGWNDVIKSLKSRGLLKVLLFITGEFTEIEQAILGQYPEAVIKLNRFIVKWGRIYPSIKNMFVRKKEYFSYVKYPLAMRRMLYTNNWIENLNRQIKRTTKIRGSFPNEKSAEKLVTLKCMEKEDHYMKYPATALLIVQDKLDDMSSSRYKNPGLQTHKT